MNKLLNALSLARRAGALQWGFDATKQEVEKGNVHLVLTASDLSPKTLKKVQAYCDGKTQLLQMPCTQSEMLPLSKKAVGIYAVCDENFAQLCRQSCPQECQPLKEDTTC